MVMNTIEKKGEESPGVQFAKAMLERKRQAIKEAQEEFKNNPEKRKVFEELKKRNEKRGTPVIKL